MRAGRAASLCAALLGCPLAALADPPDLRLEREPLPAPDRLEIRRGGESGGGGGGEGGGVSASGGEGVGVSASGGGSGGSGGERGGDLVGHQRNLEERVVFRVNLGFGLDGGEPSETQEGLGGYQVPFHRLRSYGFGEAVLGSRGLVAPSLNTYFAAQFQLENRVPDRGAAALPTARDEMRSLLIRSAYAEADGFFAHPVLRPIHLRAGRMFEYGPAVVHFDGVDVGYDLGWFAASAYVGTRVNLYTTREDRRRIEDGEDLPWMGSPVRGAALRVDLYALRKIPAVVTGSALAFDDRRHVEGAVAYQVSPDILFGAGLRWLDGAVARQSLTARVRVSEVTTVNAEIENRTESDWMYDFLAVGPSQDPSDPRRYLDLGPPLPRLHLGLRAGTVLLDNVDLLLRMAAALERDRERSSATSPTYLEGGAAAEVRVRRNLRLGAALTLRGYREDDAGAAGPHPDREMIPDPLPETGGAGERSFVEAGLIAGFTEGARVFSATIETYGRFYRPREAYTLPDLFRDRFDHRTGGRFGVEGWARRRLRLKGEYDVSFSALRHAPELRTLKTLRILMEGTF